MNFKERIVWFWRTDNKKIALVRDVLIAVIAVLIVLLILWTYTGQWFAPPMVAIESGSMQHEREPFGRFGTIDAGDMVLVQKTFVKADIIPHGGSFSGAQAENGLQTYGDYGDVVIYHPDGNMQDTQIIHRAMCWVEVSNDAGYRTYTIAEFGIYNKTSIPPIPELGLDKAVSPDWTHSGFLTKGDHNPTFDQNPYGGIPNARQPVQVNWISGKARLEIPWIGTINLFFEDIFDGRVFSDRSRVGNVPSDSLICLVIVIAILISIPIILDVHDYLKQKKQRVK